MLWCPASTKKGLAHEDIFICSAWALGFEHLTTTGQLHPSFHPKTLYLNLIAYVTLLLNV